MSFLIRAIQMNDLPQLMDLAKQFNLLNLPSDKSTLSQKIERSLKSFSGELSKEDSEYLFVIEDIDQKMVVGSSLILAKHGTEKIPHYYFKILKKDHFSKDLGLGFIHQVLRFKTDSDGPTEIGGLLIDRNYRQRLEKLGKQISLVRFLYMGLHPERFEKRVLCELTPPLTEEGRSEFWEALGRRFTGLPYQEADILSQNHKEFIQSLFPPDDIYLCLLSSKARLVVGRVGESTRPAQYLLESIGFKYLDEIDPFDGGPHYGAETQQILPIKMGQKLTVAEFSQPSFGPLYLVTPENSPSFKAVMTPVDIRENSVALPPKMSQILGVKLNDKVYLTPFEYKKKRGV
ncbi:MAG TPA: arginine N-succinyltransferase [Pseudobdellovibrionaceae bacterium]|nr:arginine N-succinyltransferase [Pseudobdellovibrionaceae bacterium]